MASRNKYHNKKIEFNGVKFASKLELHCFQMLNKFKIPFKFQEWIELQPKFSFDGEKYRAIRMRIDFILELKNHTIYLDTKGFATPEAELKFKMLAYNLMEEKSYWQEWEYATGEKKEMPVATIKWLKTQKEVNDFVLNLIADGKVLRPME